MKVSIVIVAVIAVVLAGCTDGQVQTAVPAATSRDETSAERALRESNARLQSTVVEGMMIGSATGALIGGISDGKRGALRGLQLGFIGGTAAGAYVRNLQAKYASQERVLNQVLQDIARTNAELDRSIAAMRALVAENKAAIAKATSGANERGRRDVVEMKKAISSANQQADFFGQARGILLSQGSPAGAMDPQLAKLAQRIATMKELSASLSAAL